jgi:serine/threonine protein kinase
MMKYDVEKLLYSDKNRKICLVRDLKTSQLYLYKINISHGKPLVGNNLLKYVDNEYFPKLIESDFSVTTPYCILEYIDGIDMYDWMSAKKEINILHVSSHLCKAVQYLHHMNIIHCDIKPENIIRTNNPLIPYKLIDFDTALKINSDKMSKFPKKIIGTIGFVSPEVYDNFHYSDKLDIFSIGVTIYNLATNSMPYKWIDERGCFGMRTKGYYDCPNIEIDQKLLSNYPIELIDLLNKMLIFDYNERCDIDQTLSHPYFYPKN